ncbi:hypothetical protein PoB_003226600 [Plakobranchus ocellatus]|uniref:PH domain-containing protein n=1 Tax=Plakobranchus ocellatus TaxID=259542 RepID=A0AAV4AGK4_9GAST|nr:hypothetical protein PoB_003226600 [Plakobranchus ocellatus]
MPSPPNRGHSNGHFMLSVSSIPGQNKTQAYISPRSPRPVEHYLPCRSNNNADVNDKNEFHDTTDGHSISVKRGVQIPIKESSDHHGALPTPDGRGRSRFKDKHGNKNRELEEVTSQSKVMSRKNSNNSPEGKAGDGERGKTARIMSRRMPSPKRSAAPTPPCPRNCPSPAPKPVSTSDVSPADVEGWLVDQLRGRRVWCVLSDMLFCVFERPDAPTSKQVLMLPGCKVRVLEFKSAHFEGRLLHGVSPASRPRLMSYASSSSASSVATNQNDHYTCNGIVTNMNNAYVSYGNGSSPTITSSKCDQIPSTGSTSSETFSHTNSQVRNNISNISSINNSEISYNINANTANNNDNNSNRGSTSSTNSIDNNNSKTVSGVDRFQFVIENSITRQKHMFAVASRSELELWTQALNKACSLDITAREQQAAVSDGVSASKNRTQYTNHKRLRSLAAEDIIVTKSPATENREHTEKQIPNGMSSSQSPRSNRAFNEESISPSYSPCQTLPSRIDVHSLSLSLTQQHDVSRETVDEIRRKLKKDNSDTIESKPTPLRATHDLDESAAISPRSVSTDNSTPRGGETSRKGRSFFKGRSPLDVLLGRKKRSSSADDAYRNRKMFPIYNEEDSLSNPSFSPRRLHSGSQNSLESSHSSQSHNHAHDSSFSNSSADSREGSRKHGSRKHKGESSLTRSWDPEKNPSGIGSSLRRTASDLKERVFGSGSSSSTKNNQTTKPPGLKLKDLTDARVSGNLHYRLAFKFIKVFCVLSKGCFYAFKSEKPEEFPLLAMVLAPCAVTYVVESELDLHRKIGSGRKKSKQQQRLFAFKLSQPHCKSIYACADSHETLLRWMMAIQTEAARVQVDEALAAEIREKPSKKKQSKDAPFFLHSKSSDLHTVSNDNLKRPEKRHSCPSLDNTLGKLDSVQGISEKSLLTSSVKNHHVESMSSTSDHKLAERPVALKGSLSSALHRTKSDRDINKDGIHLGEVKQRRQGSFQTRIFNDKHSLSRKNEYPSFESDTLFSSPTDGTEPLSSVSSTSSAQATSNQGLARMSSADNSESHSSSLNETSVGENLKLDLSSLNGDKNATLSSHSDNNFTSFQSFNCHAKHQNRSSSGLEAERTKSFTTSEMKRPWKTSVKRTSSLNSSSAKSFSSSSTSSSSTSSTVLFSSLLPSRSKILDDMNLRTSSTLHGKEQTSAKLTSFFSQQFNLESTALTTKGESPYSDFPGYREFASEQSINPSLTAGFNDASDFGLDVITPPPLFRSSETMVLDTSSDLNAYLTETVSPDRYNEDTDRPPLPLPPTIDETVKEVWSHDEEFLLGVIRDKLRRRRQREPEGEESSNHLTNQPVLNRVISRFEAHVWEGRRYNEFEFTIMGFLPI